MLLPSGRRTHERCFPCLLILASAFGGAQTCVAETAMVPWLTRSFDNSRSGWNPDEKVLTQASVGTKGIVRATIIPVFGDARGMEAQPLVLLTSSSRMAPRTMSGGGRTPAPSRS